MDKKDTRIKDLLRLEFCIVDAIHEEIEWNMEGHQSNIAETIKCILEEKRVRDMIEENKDD